MVDEEIRRLLVSEEVVSLFGFQGVVFRLNQIKAQRSGFDLKRRCNEMSELSPKGETERYGVCIDDMRL